MLHMAFPALYWSIISDCLPVLLTVHLCTGMWISVFVSLCGCQCLSVLLSVRSPVSLCVYICLEWRLTAVICVRIIIQWIDCWQVCVAQSCRQVPHSTQTSRPRRYTQGSVYISNNCYGDSCHGNIVALTLLTVTFLIWFDFYFAILSILDARNVLHVVF